MMRNAMIPPGGADFAVSPILRNNSTSDIKGLWHTLGKYGQIIGKILYYNIRAESAGFVLLNLTLPLTQKRNTAGWCTP